MCLLLTEEAYCKLFVGFEVCEASENAKDFMSIRESTYITVQQETKKYRNP
jgi:hypothetical protein